MPLTFFHRFAVAAALAAALLSAAPAQAKPLHALAMTDAPLYAPKFEHFAYANPNAPKGGFLKLGTTGTFDSLNPFTVRGQTPFGLGSGTMSLVYESLMARGWDEPFTLYGLIAEGVEVADDRSWIVFNLNAKARFSDGKTITADDVYFSFETLRDKGRPNHRTYYKKVAYAEKLSPARIKFTFKPGDKGVYDREMPLIMGLMPVMPKHEWAGREFNETSLRFPIGSGPYKVVTLDIGRSITYERDTQYWGRDLPVMRGFYNFNKIRIDYYRDDSVSLQAFKAGQYDLRRESDPTKWAAAYDFPALREGHVRLERLEHKRTEPAYGFVFNTRRALFADLALRDALQHSFDFEWVNRNLFRGQYKRGTSLFPNSELAATGLPQGRELKLLDAYRSKLPPDLFTQDPAPPAADNEMQFREELLKAETKLRVAGYKIKDDQLYAPNGQAVSFEIMLSDPSEEKVALNWGRALKRLGITLRTRTVDSAQFQKRLAAFDYDVVATRWYNSLSPGNEQMYFWGSAAAGQQGSRNYAGVRDTTVDALAAAIPNAKTREDLVAAARALDRVLMNGHYFIPLYYMGADNIASWKHMRHPDRMSLYGNVLETWWAQ